MPTIRLTSVEGYSEAQIRAFMDEAHQLALRVLKAAPESVIIQVEILPPSHYMRAGKTVTEHRAGAATR